MDCRKELLSKRTAAEKAVCATLDRMGVKYIPQMPIKTGRKTFYADIYVPSLRLVIEVDGKYHFTDRQRRKDENRSQCLRRMGLHVYRISNPTAPFPKTVLSLLRRCRKRQKGQFGAEG